MNRRESALDGRLDDARAVDRGQSTVELALALPLVTLALLLVVQVGLVVHDQVLVTGAAREAARTAAVAGAGDRSAIERAAARAGPLDPSRLEVEIAPEPEGTVRVVVRYRARTSLPLIGALVPDVDLRAVAVMRRE
ncbi:MAG: TadE/TadG family type IV pilus assembly protein [Acidimicrobiales bacterium]